MKQKIINISLDEIFPAARGYFSATAGFGSGSEKHRRMWCRAMEIYEDISQKAEMKALVRYEVPDTMEGKDISFHGVTFSSNAFERLIRDNVNGAYFYLLTAGRAETDSDQVMDQLYADIWGTSLVDAASDRVKADIMCIELEKGDGGMLSSPFGPGYYGMALGQTAEFFRIIDASLLGVALSPGGMMLPQKSVTGFYLSVKDKNQLPPISCESCIGGSSGCAFCNVRG